MSVYIIGAPGAATVKVGYSLNPWQRLATLRSAHGKNLRLLAVIPGDRRCEMALHDLLHEVATGHEWFLWTSFIGELCAAYEPGPGTPKRAYRYVPRGAVRLYAWGTPDVFEQERRRPTKHAPEIRDVLKAHVVREAG